MSRGIGVVEALPEVLPAWIVLLLGLLTQLGDAWFVGLVFALLYWHAPAEREAVATAAGATIAGVGLYRAIKHVLALPRPERVLLDEAELSGAGSVLYELTATAGGYGFPSGHATTSTVAYLGLASLLAIGTRRRRYVVAAAIVTVVGVTRVALGVHYVADVVAGVALAGALLVGLHWLLDRAPYDGPVIAFGLAIPAGVAYVLASNATPESLLVLVVAAVGVLGWRRFGGRRR